jgi:plastocyanin
MISATRGATDSAKRSRRFSAPSACAIAGLALCLGAAPAAAGGPAPPGPTSSIHDRIYTPSSITVAAGQTITWRNETLGPHTVTSTSELFNSGRIEGGTSYSLKLSNPGTFDYYCTIHPTMKGVVTVLAIPAERVLLRVTAGRAGGTVRVQVARSGIAALLQAAPARGGAFKTIARALLSSQGTASFSVGGRTARRARVLVGAAYGQPRLVSRTVSLP